METKSNRKSTGINSTYVMHVAYIQYIKSLKCMFMQANLSRISGCWYKRIKENEKRLEVVSCPAV